MGTTVGQPSLVLSDTIFKSLTLFHSLGKIYSRCFADMAPNADIQISAISALKMFADNRYADIGKKCRYADIADTDINIGTSLLKMSYIFLENCTDGDCNSNSSFKFGL